MRQFASVDLPDDKMRLLLSKKTTDLIVANKKWIDDVVSQMRAGFLADDANFGALIIELFASIKDKLDDRLNVPFAEMDFLVELNQENFAGKLEEFMNSFGGCLVFRDMGVDASGEKDDDKLMVLGDASSIFHNSRGWEVFQASVHYSIAHLYKKNGRIEVSPPGKPSKCPLFSSCGHANKKFGIENCSSFPWLHAAPSGDGADCAYQLAVFKAKLENYKVTDEDNLNANFPVVD
jgi:hypothetical protein